MGTRNPAPSLQRPMRKCFVCGDCGPCACRRTAGGLGRHRLKRQVKTLNPREGKALAGLWLGSQNLHIFAGGWKGPGRRHRIGMGPRILGLGPESTLRAAGGHNHRRSRCGCVVQPTPKGWASSKAHLLGDPDSCHFHPRFMPFSSGISLKTQIHAIFTRDSCHFHPASSGIKTRFAPDSCHFHQVSARESAFMPFSSGIRARVWIHAIFVRCHTASA